MADRTCDWCLGSGRQLVMRSWFPADGYRRIRCGICRGDGVIPQGTLRADIKWKRFQERATAATAQAEAAE